MASGVSYGYGKPKYIANGLLVRRRNVSPARSIVLQNIVRLLKENQTNALAEQTILDGWSSPLNIIPNTRFHIGSGRNFNDLSCNLIYTGKNEHDNSVGRELDISLLVTVEEGTEVEECFTRSDSYITAYESILDTFFTFAKPELVYDFRNSLPEKPVFFDMGVETAEILGTAVINANSLPGLNRAIGFLPTLNIKIILNPSSK